MAGKTIQVSRGYTAVVDAEDFAALSAFTWHPLFGSRGRVYARRTVRVDGRRRTILMHREIARPARGVDVDHADRDGLNNRRSNLRLVTVSQNMANAVKRDGRVSSRFKGVSWDAERNRWRARLGVRGAYRFIGRFAAEEEAARAYDVAALAAFGEFARCNLAAARGSVA